ncbi:hypothetical protein AQV86_02255 [Nanohaloarchaea archaeon SG9]|nr:hypothetical protein AQV86_02255 [Nanohaloarchaea archaeon SG9]
MKKAVFKISGSNTSATSLRKFSINNQALFPPENFNRKHLESLYMSVWSAEKFAEGEIDTWPFEHDYILAYRGTSREIFFPREHSSSMKNYPGGQDKKLASVLNTRYLIPTNNNGNTGQNSFEAWKEWYMNKIKQEEGLTDEEAHRVWKEFLEAGKENRDPMYDEKMDTREPGNFFAPRNVVEEKGYYRPQASESILLKVHIPTDLVTVVNRLKNRDNIRCDSLELMERNYTKEEFREQCRIATQLRNNEQLQYATADLDLKYVRGVEDKDCSEGLVSIMEYVRWLKKECVWEMDRFSISVKAHDDIEEEMQFLKEMEYRIEKLKYYLKQMDRQAHNVKDLTEKIREEYDDNWRRYRAPRKSELKETVQFLRTAEKSLTGQDMKGPGYPEVRKQLYELLEQQTKYFSSRDNSKWSKGYKQDLETRFNEKNISNIRELFRNLDTYLDTAQIIEEEIEEIRKEEKQKIKREEWEEDQYEKERRLEQKIERRLAKEATKLPNIKALKQEIDEKRRKAEKEQKQVSKGENPPKNNYLGLKV